MRDTLHHLLFEEPCVLIMYGRYKYKLLKKIAALLVSCIAGMCIMHAFDIRKENQSKASAKIARYQRKVSSEEENTSLSRRLKQDKLGYGEVVHGTKHIIVYNSVPKCGRRTFEVASRTIFKKRSISFTPFRLTKKDKRKRSQNELHSLVEGMKAPAFGEGHGFFEPFDKEPRPVYVNFIRDPVSRMVSLFYWRRNGDQNTKGRHSPYNRTMEECILESHDYCVKPGIPLEQFCGYDDRCRSNLTWALEQAKSNIDKYYTFIGITEDYEASLRVLEHLMPDMYSGVTEVYLSSLNDTRGISTMTKTINKEPLSQRLSDTLTELLAVDYQLYNHIYDRHRALKARYGIN